MPYPGDIEANLGFDQIRNRLNALCISTLGTKRVDEIIFSTDVEQVRDKLFQNHEFKRILEQGEPFPSSQFFDPSDVVKKTRLEGAFLEEGEFLNLAWSVQTILACKDFLTKKKQEFPQLFKLTEPVAITKSFPATILSIIDESGIVKDSASPELNRIRKKLRDEQSHLRKLIDQAYRHAVAEQWVPEGGLPTIRGGRLVLPILAEFKRKVKGFIHDESASGQTVFMEPAEVLEINNEIRDLEHAERREVSRLLRELTDEVREQLPELELSYEFLSWMDFIRAKAKLAIEIRSFMPQLEKKPYLKWMNAKHPLLYLSLFKGLQPEKSKREVVPLNIDLNEKDRMLLVSGPNAGGKSVCLKTVGLLQYMLQCGLLIPVSPDSTAGIFEDILIDIGDQQSIENDLSTYSSHLKNMTYFIQHASDKTLVLMDELGSGTDPNFGGAIAQSVLQTLLNKKVWAVATTHYYKLKLFAGQQEGIRNAAMRFDENNLAPLYILDIGKPGSSFALEIAQKTGLPDETLKHAQQLVGKDLIGFDKLVRNFEQEKNELTKKIKSLEQQEVRLTNALAKYEKLTSELEQRRKEIIEKSKLEAQQLLKETNREIEKTIRHIRENQAQRTETQKARKSLQGLAKKVGTQPILKSTKDSEPIRAGDRVRLIGQDGNGTVLSIKGKSAWVLFGELKSKVDLSKLEKSSVAREVQPAGKPRVQGVKLYEKQATFNPVLDIRGKHVEEVIPLLDQFMDTATLLSHGELKIVHGKGEGILRKVIREQLKTYKQVASFADEHVERGGDGITVVVLK